MEHLDDKRTARSAGRSAAGHAGEARNRKKRTKRDSSARCARPRRTDRGGGQAWSERLRQPAVIVQFSRLMSTDTSDPGQVSALGITMPWMFVPGDKQRMLDKALGLHVDAIMMDLEDGVAPAEKARARSQIAATLQGVAAR